MEDGEMVKIAPQVKAGELKGGRKEQIKMRYWRSPGGTARPSLVSLSQPVARPASTMHAGWFWNAFSPATYARQRRLAKKRLEALVRAQVICSAALGGQTALVIDDAVHL